MSPICDLCGRRSGCVGRGTRRYASPRPSSDDAKVEYFTDAQLAVSVWRQLRERNYLCSLVLAKDAIGSKIKNRSGGRLADKAMCSHWAKYLEAVQSERAKFRGRFR